MKSKKSFFNKTIFKKNMTLYWPIWTLYTLFLVFVQPVMFWSSCYYSKFYESYTYNDKLRDLMEVIYLDVHVYFIALMALASGMALFHYLYNHKSANMIHAFPVDRTQLFGTNVISGLLFLAIPQTISCVLLAIVALLNGVMEVYYVAYWWLLAVGTDIVAMSVVTFCAMFTGHLLALPVYAIVLNYFSYFVYYLIYIVVVLFRFGINDLGQKAQRITALFSPTECFAYNIGLCCNFDPITGECTGGLVYGVEVLAIYLVVAAVLYAAAFLTYKKRHIEQAGEFITVGWVKPIFRFGIAMAGGIFGGMLMREFLRNIGIGCNMVVFAILMLLLGGCCFFVADMLLHKSFRVFKKKNWINCGITLVFMLVSFFGISQIGKAYEDYQPELSEIKVATVNWGYEVELTGEEVETILAIHKEILDNKEICIAEEESGNWYYEYVSIKYILKDGDVVRRSYQIPYEREEMDAILTQISDLETDVDNYLQFVFGKNYEEIKLFNGGNFEAPFMDGIIIDEYGNVEDYTYESRALTSEQAKEMYEAIIADVKEGTLMKYNVHSQWIREGNEKDSWKYSDAGLWLEFQRPDEKDDTHLVIEEYSYTYPHTGTEQYVDVQTWGSEYVSFGADCENIINKLIEFGYITSVDDIWWGEISEEVKY